MSRHASTRHEDSCSLACQAAIEGAGNCTTYVGRHRADAVRTAVAAAPYPGLLEVTVSAECPLDRVYLIPKTLPEPTP